MAATPSAMVELGTKAPGFNLPDTISGKQISLDEIKSDKATVVMFICNHCPYVIHIIEKLSEVIKEYQKKGISFVAISSNDVQNYPQDSPDKMKEFAEEFNFSFPYLYDETQEVAKAYQAECTPDIFVFDKELKLVYRGQFDDSRPSKDTQVTGKDLTAALDAILEGKHVSEKQIPSVGCNIKWKR
ncbi:MAG: thioredoxin family protein [Melioribacteraceae bacterium]|jgi:peroxiredoxin|nr:thioredoxin family protein [Melioribacteraceae bacterium]RJP59454.1 MAG: thioredoxin family protein [Ignavibacteriales bacterium]WKZ69626.1 MAG: thioredoxin family protein [Melioribacteraceae bacterium]WKZ69637.1 MAG: thioredoxin family protein [Melioribacteraceae bacterium]